MNETLGEKLVELREHVHQLNSQPALVLRGNTFKAPDEIPIVKHDNWAIGYTLDEGEIAVKRSVFIKIEKHKFDEIPEEDREKVFNLCFDVFFDKGEAVPEINVIADDAIAVTQYFMPAYLYEKNPNIVVPGKK